MSGLKAVKYSDGTESRDIYETKDWTMVTIRVPRDLVKQIKVLAAKSGKRLGDTYVDLLKKGLVSGK